MHGQHGLTQEKQVFDSDNNSSSDVTKSKTQAATASTALTQVIKCPYCDMSPVFREIDLDHHIQWTERTNHPTIEEWNKMKENEKIARL